MDEAATLADPDKEIHYDETRAFSRQHPGMFIANISASHRINRPKASKEVGVASLNVSRAAERYGLHYNLQKGIIE